MTKATHITKSIAGNRRPWWKRLLRRAPVLVTRKLEYGDHNRPCTCHGPGDDWYRITGTDLPHNDGSGDGE